MPLPFNKSLDLKLIHLVKDNSILYNTRDPKYLDFDSREVVWQKIGDALNRPALVCKSRWINIRDMMRRKIRERHRNPTQRVYNYKYEQELSFMFPFFKEPIGNSAVDYSEFLDDNVSSCEMEMSNEIFVEEAMDFEKQDKDYKPNIAQMRSKESNDFQVLNPTDPLDTFLITIGSTLRKFSPYFLNQAKSKIFQIVQDYELQQIVDKDQPSSSNAQS